jgi:hypothetical protein
MRAPSHTPNDISGRSRMDRLAMRLAMQSKERQPARPHGTAMADGPLSRRKVIGRALAAGTLMMLPLRLFNPTPARAEGYCAAQCLDDANTAYNTRLTKCFVSAFGTDIPDQKAFATYVAAKIRSGGLGALVLANEIASAEACGIVDQLHYHYDAARCGDPGCGNSKKYPRPATGVCQGCKSGYHCCVCRDYNDGKPLPNLLVNGGYSCAQYCSTLGFTEMSDTPC